MSTRNKENSRPDLNSTTTRALSQRERQLSKPVTAATVQKPAATNKANLLSQTQNVSTTRSSGRHAAEPASSARPSSSRQSSRAAAEAPAPSTRPTTASTRKQELSATMRPTSSATTDKKPTSSTPARSRKVDDLSDLLGDNDAMNAAIQKTRATPARAAKEAESSKALATGLQPTGKVSQRDKEKNVAAANKRLIEEAKAEKDRAEAAAAKKERARRSKASTAAAAAATITSKQSKEPPRPVRARTSRKPVQSDDSASEYDEAESEPASSEEESDEEQPAAKPSKATAKTKRKHIAEPMTDASDDEEMANDDDDGDATADNASPYLAGVKHEVLEESFADSFHERTHRLGLWGYHPDKRHTQPSADYTIDMFAASDESKRVTFINQATGYKQLAHEPPNNVNERHAAAELSYQRVSQTVRDAVKDENQSAFDEVRSFVHNTYTTATTTPISVSTPSFYDASVVGRIQHVDQLPVGLLLTGINVSDNELLIDQLLDSLEDSKSTASQIVVAHISSSALMQSVHQAILSILNQLMLSYTPSVVKSDVLTRAASVQRSSSVIQRTASTQSTTANAKQQANTFQQFDTWYERCQTAVKQQQQSKQESSDDMADNDDTDEITPDSWPSNETLWPKLVVIVDEVESLQPRVLDALIQQFLTHPLLQPKPFTLLLTSAATSDTLHAMVHTGTASRLWLHTFVFNTTSVIMDRLVKSLFVSQRFPLLLSSSVLEFLLTYYYDDAYSLQWLLSVFQSMFAFHYAKTPCSHLVTARLTELPQKVTHSDLHALSQLPSIQSKIKSSETQQPTKEQVVKWVTRLRSYQRFHSVACGILQQLYDLTTDEPSSARDDVETLCIEESRQAVIKKVLGTVRAAEKPVLLSWISQWLSVLTGEQAAEKVATLRKQHFAVDITALRYLKADVESDKAARADKQQEDDLSSTQVKRGMSASQRSAHLHSASKSKLGELQANGKLVEEWLAKFFTKHLPTVTSLPLHELFYFSNHHSLQSLYQAQPHLTIQKALETSSNYLQQDKTKLQANIKLLLDVRDVRSSKRRKRQGDDVADEDLQIMFTAYKEYPKYIALYPWYKQFCSMASTEDKVKMTPELQTRFMNNLAVMKELGFIKAATANKKDHVVKLIQTVDS